MLMARRWLELWQRLGATRRADSALADAFTELTKCYAEKHRHYHTARHIAECLALLDEARALSEHPDEVELALWFHDAIYNTHAKHNEAQSADWSVRVLKESGAAQAVMDRVHALIMATCHAALPKTRDACVLVDIDLSILGATPQRFDAYELEIRAEYAWVPEILFRATRRKILGEFLQRPSIYSTDDFKQKLENSARANLARSLQALA
jgi:predicted metal-dependent HD superfamily phosphohydrolase